MLRKIRAKEAHVLAVIQAAKLESARRTEAARAAADAERRQLGASLARRTQATTATAATPPLTPTAAARAQAIAEDLPPSPKRVADLRTEPPFEVEETKFVGGKAAWAAVAGAALSPAAPVPTTLETAAAASETKVANDDRRSGRYPPAGDGDAFPVAFARTQPQLPHPRVSRAAKMMDLINEKMRADRDRRRAAG